MVWIASLYSSRHFQSSETVNAALTSGQTGEIIHATLIAGPFRDELRENIAGFSIKQKLGVFENNRGRAKKYADWTGRAFIADGIDFELNEVCRSVFEIFRDRIYEG